MNAKRGYQAELMCRAELEKRGFLVMRSAASKGPYDLIAINENRIIFIQVKRTKDRMRSAPPVILRKLKNAVAPMAPLISKELWVWVDYEGWRVTKV